MLARRPHSRIARRIRRAAAIALVGLGVYVLLGLPFFVLPQQGPLPRHADVVLVLGPPRPERLSTADRLREEGVVDEVLISVPVAPGPLEGGRWADCFAGRLPHTTCFRPDPATTQGEARELGRRAAELGWTSAVITTETAHLSRSGLIVGRCFSGSVILLASGEPPSGGWAAQYVYQTGATLKALLVTTTC